MVDGKVPTTLLYTYDAYSRLVAVPQTQTTQFTMLYNGFDQRVQLSVNAVPTYAHSLFYTGLEIEYVMRPSFGPLTDQPHSVRQTP